MKIREDLNQESKQYLALKERWDKLMATAAVLNEQMYTGKRRCDVCKKKRMLSDFYLFPPGADGLTKDCKKCRIKATQHNQEKRKLIGNFVASLDAAIGLPRKYVRLTNLTKIKKGKSTKK